MSETLHNMPTNPADFDVVSYGAELANPDGAYQQTKRLHERLGDENGYVPAETAQDWLAAKEAQKQRHQEGIGGDNADDYYNNYHNAHPTNHDRPLSDKSAAELNADLEAARGLRREPVEGEKTKLVRDAKAFDPTAIDDVKAEQKRRGKLEEEARAEHQQREVARAESEAHKEAQARAEAEAEAEARKQAEAAEKARIEAEKARTEAEAAAEKAPHEVDAPTGPIDTKKVNEMLDTNPVPERDEHGRTDEERERSEQALADIKEWAAKQPHPLTPDRPMETIRQLGRNGNWRAITDPTKLGVKLALSSKARKAYKEATAVQQDPNATPGQKAEAHLKAGRKLAAANVLKQVNADHELRLKGLSEESIQKIQEWNGQGKPHKLNKAFKGGDLANVESGLTPEDVKKYQEKRVRGTRWIAGLSPEDIGYSDLSDETKEQLLHDRNNYLVNHKRLARRLEAKAIQRVDRRAIEGMTEDDYDAYRQMYVSPEARDALDAIYNGPILEEFSRRLDEDRRG